MKVLFIFCSQARYINEKQVAFLNLYPNTGETFKDELRCLSISASKIASQDLKFERLVIKSDLALQMFKYNKSVANRNGTTQETV